MTCPACAWRVGHAADCPLRRVAVGTRHAILTGMQDAKPTMPPGPADEAALQHARDLAATGADRTADWWAALERRAAELGLRTGTTTGG